ncbi:patatin-like phospholipase family protein [Mycoplasmatota bacterium]|nr:patatin-like phospholipase family protein [Mycoplasmatota bacterium]
MNYYYGIKNLAFSGGGVLGIAYLGVLDYLYSNGLLQSVKRVAGTSAGAITACIVSFALPFKEMKNIADSLDYRKFPGTNTHKNLKKIPSVLKNELERIIGDIDGIYRLTKDFGWYSSEYFYDWIKEQIEIQFDPNKKQPPYTFRDFKNKSIHKDERKFLDLYITGTDISTNSSRIFSYETTPDMEVAEAVRISMSIPLFFESIRINKTIDNEEQTHIFSDGGVMTMYPINMFDSRIFNDIIIDGVNMQTLGIRFKSKYVYEEITNILDYIENLVKSLMKVQQDLYKNNLVDVLRSIQIDTKEVSSTDFDISLNDEKYKFLYQQGYNATKEYFKNKT